MKNIVEILTRRNTAAYYKDCHYGLQLHRIHTITTESALLANEDADEIDLQDKLTAVFGDGAEKFSRQDAPSVLASVMADRAVSKAASKMPCAKYDRCILCPAGHKIIAQEIYEYTFSGTNG